MNSLENNISNQSVRDEVLELFLTNKDKKIVKFFVSPCFSCKNQIWDSDGDEYSSWNWPDCDESYDFPALEYFIEHKKEFPYCEAPKLCHRKGLFRPSITNGRFSDFDCIGYGILGNMEDFDYDAPSIAGSVIGFHRRMSEVRI